MSNSKINQVEKVFISLKQKSYTVGKNCATMNNIAKESNTSRNNFYEQAKKFEVWNNLVEEIKYFKIEFNEFLNVKTQPLKEQKRIRELSEKLKTQMEQNLELLNDFNHLYEQIKEKNNIIEHLEKRIQILMQINYNGDKNEK